MHKHSQATKWKIQATRYSIAANAMYALLTLTLNPKEVTIQCHIAVFLWLLFSASFAMQELTPVLCYTLELLHQSNKRVKSLRVQAGQRYKICSQVLGYELG